MSYLVDTNVLSKLWRRHPEPRVFAWFAARSAQSLLLSVLTLSELRKGISSLGHVDAARRQALSDWLEVDLPTFFLGRILAVYGPVANRWGFLQAQEGPLPAIDSSLAATAAGPQPHACHRNVRGFAGLGLRTYP